MSVVMGAAVRWSPVGGNMRRKPADSEQHAPAQPETFETRSVRGTVALGGKLARRLAPGDCVALVGPLGAGKTALTRGIAAGLGLDDGRLVSSPTYVLVQEYPCDTTLYHVDLYRMGAPEAELIDLGLDEMLAGGIVLIEWADRAPGALPPAHLRIEIEIISPVARRFTLSRPG